MTEALGDPTAKSISSPTSASSSLNRVTWDQATTHWHAALTILERLRARLRLPHWPN
jgi:hypothetical protein